MDFDAGKFNPFAQGGDYDLEGASDDVGELLDDVGDVDEDNFQPFIEDDESDPYNDVSFPGHSEDGQLDLEERDPEELRAFLANNGGSMHQEDDGSFKEQVEYNRFLLGDSAIAGDVGLIDDASESYNFPPKYTPEVVNLSVVFVYSVALVVFLAAVGIFGNVYLANSKSDLMAAQNYVAPQMNNPVGDGAPFESGAASDADVVEEGQEEGREEKEEGNVRYELTADKGIERASLSYIGSGGKPASATNVTMPWSKSVEVEDGYSPLIRVNTSGSGTLTCVIVKDGTQVAKETVSGDNPSITCDASAK